MQSSEAEVGVQKWRESTEIFILVIYISVGSCLFLSFYRHPHPQKNFTEELTNLLMFFWQRPTY